MIPKEITEKHLFFAAQEIDRDGIPNKRNSRGHYIIVKDNTYPPKYLVSIAARIATGKELDSSLFISTEAISFLRTKGFKTITQSIQNGKY